MYDVKITYNLALELIIAIDKFVTLSFNIIDARTEEASKFEQLEKEAYIDFTPNPEIKEWCEQTNRRMSPFLRNDIIHFLGVRPAYMGCFYNIIVHNNLIHPHDLILHLKSMTPESLIAEAFEMYRTDCLITDDHDTVLNELIQVSGVDEGKLFSYLLEHPLEFKNKSISIIEQFYEVHFEKDETTLKSKLDEKLSTHQQLLDNDPREFLLTIGLGDYTKIMDKNYPIIMFISYYTDLGVSYMIDHEVCYIQYGISMEERFNKQRMEIKYKNLFKALADETRREIVRLTSVRPWFNKELAEHFGLTTATLSYHLNMLLDLDILNFDPTDNYRYFYVANKEKIKLLFDIMLKDLIRE